VSAAALAAACGPSWAIAQSPAPALEKWVAPTVERSRTNPLPPDSENVKRGRRLFLQHCAVCHGDNGRGDGPTARMHARRSGHSPQDLTLLQVQDALTDGEIFWKITTGFRVGKKIIMPATAGEVSVDDRWRLVLFIRSLLPSGATE
jgi:mono/diheme cytochrome c family protein